PGRGDAPSLADVGLDKPRVVVTLATEAGQTQTLRLGRKAIGGRAYLMINEDDALYVVNDALHRELMDKKIADLRQKSLSAPEEGQAQWVQVMRDGQAIEVTKHDGQWTFAGEHRGRVSTATVRATLAG